VKIRAPFISIQYRDAMSQTGKGPLSIVRKIMEPCREGGNRQSKWIDVNRDRGIRRHNINHAFPSLDTHRLCKSEGVLVKAWLDRAAKLDGHGRISEGQHPEAIPRRRERLIHGNPIVQLHLESLLDRLAIRPIRFRCFFNLVVQFIPFPIVGGGIYRIRVKTIDLSVV
jgi:hypothetical protein